jgi:hypothetical protein
MVRTEFKTECKLGRASRPLHDLVGGIVCQMIQKWRHGGHVYVTDLVYYLGGDSTKNGWVEIMETYPLAANVFVFKNLFLAKVAIVHKKM